MTSFNDICRVFVQHLQSHCETYFEVLQLGGTAVLCRVLPKVKPPCSYSLLSIRAQIAALKMSMVLQASEMLADASIVPAFIRMCGATFGHGCAMGLQVWDFEEELGVT